jgi:exonuclease SbcC
MINSLSISNFQSHKDSTLEFDGGVNIITGQSDSGKSAILRALNWVVNNKPSGDAFRSNWGGDTEVKIQIGKEDVARKKGKGNYYDSHINKTATRFASFGQDVPDKIKKLINFSPLNMQGQLESPFLLAMSGGEVARYLNKIVHLDVIDKSLFNIGRVLNKERQDCAYTCKDLEEVKEKIKEYVWIDEAEGCLVKLETFANTLECQKNRNFELQITINKIIGLEEDIEEVSKLTQYEDELNKLIKHQELIKTNENRVGRLNVIITNIEIMIDKKLNILKENLEEWQEEFEAIMPDICPLCGRGE